MALTANEKAALEAPRTRQNTLRVARALLTTEDFNRLHKSHREVTLTQMAVPMIGAVLVVIAMLVASTHTEKILVYGGGGLIAISLIWMVLTPRFTGQLWRDYQRWYRSGAGLAELNDLFGRDQDMK